jgi:hypothetical protein
LVQTDEERKKNRREYLRKYEAREDVKLRRKTSRLKPEYIEKRKIRDKEYNSRSEVKEKKKEYANRSENKLRDKLHRLKPDIKAKREKYLQNYKARRKELDARPEVKAKNKVYKAKPDNKKRARELERDLRYLVLQTYSKRLSNSEIPCCKCCHLNSHIAFLAVDHIAGKKQMDSEPELKKLGYSSKFQSWVLLRWLKRNNFPEGFQILCHSCNHAKGHSKNNKCPLENKPH